MSRSRLDRRRGQRKSGRSRLGQQDQVTDQPGHPVDLVEQEGAGLGDLLRVVRRRAARGGRAARSAGSSARGRRRRGTAAARRTRASSRASMPLTVRVSAVMSSLPVSGSRRDRSVSLISSAVVAQRAQRREQAAGLPRGEAGDRDQGQQRRRSRRSASCRTGRRRSSSRKVTTTTSAPVVVAVADRLDGDQQASVAVGRIRSVPPAVHAGARQRPRTPGPRARRVAGRWAGTSRPASSHQPTSSSSSSGTLRLEEDAHHRRRRSANGRPVSGSMPRRSRSVANSSSSWSHLAGCVARSIRVGLDRVDDQAGPGQRERHQEGDGRRDPGTHGDARPTRPGRHVWGSWAQSSSPPPSAAVVAIVVAAAVVVPVVVAVVVTAVVVVVVDIARLRA